jgi:hypothetical protein
MEEAQDKQRSVIKANKAKPSSSALLKQRKRMGNLALSLEAAGQNP